MEDKWLGILGCAVIMSILAWQSIRHLFFKEKNYTIPTIWKFHMSESDADYYIDKSKWNYIK